MINLYSSCYVNLISICCNNIQNSWVKWAYICLIFCQIFKLWVFLLLTSLFHMASGRELNHWLHYRTVFVKDSKLFSTFELWTHTFIIKSKDPATFGQLPFCQYPPFTQFFEQLWNQSTDASHFISTVQSQILHILTDLTYAGQIKVTP